MKDKTRRSKVCAIINREKKTLPMGGNTLATEQKKILESDLFQPVSDFLTEEGYRVRSEVKDCDITAVKGEELVVVELKRNLSVELLAQAAKRQKLADLVYVAVPKPKKLKADAKWRDITHLLRRLELGLMFVSFKGKRGIVEIPVHPEPFDREKSRKNSIRKRENLLKEAAARNMDANVGGSTRRKLMTAYRENSLHIACCLERYGPLSPKKLREKGTDPKKTSTILQDNHYHWFERIQTGIYVITETGKGALEQYKELAQYYYEVLEQKESESNVE